MSTQVTNFSLVIKNVCLPSLEDISLLSIIKYIMDVEHEEICKIFCEHFNPKWLSTWFPSDKVSKITFIFKLFPIPEVLEAKYTSLVHWVIDQYKDWIYFVMKEILLESLFSRRKDHVGCIVNAVKWNINGSINYHLSMQYLWYDINRVEGRKIKFKIASDYCLEDNMKFLWVKLTPAEKKAIFEEEDKTLPYSLQLYWACTITGDMGIFLKFVHKYVKHKAAHYHEVLKLDIDFLSDADNCGFILAVLEGSSAAVKYFCKKSTSSDKEFLVHLIEIYLKRIGCKLEGSHEDIDVLYFLLNRINDDEIFNRIFEQYFMVFLRLSIKYWPCHKYLGNLVKMSSGGIDYILFYELMTALLYDVQEEKTYKLLLLKSLWRNISIEVKKSFCLFISNIKRDNLDMMNLWEYMTIDLMDLLLKDEEFKKISAPYENNGITELILAEKYDVVDHWVEKCLISEEAIISFMENLIITKSVEIFKTLRGSTIIIINKFIDWVFKYEEFMNKNEISRIKDEAVELVCVKACLSGIVLEKWEDLQKFSDWILKNRNDFEDKWIDLKKKTLQEFFVSHKSYSASWKQTHFVKSLIGFLGHGVSDTVKLKAMISEIDFYESYICYNWLKKDWLSVNSFFKFLSNYDVDVLKIKQNFFHGIFPGGESCFEEQSFCYNMEKLLYWNSETDPNIKKKIWEIKKAIIKGLVGYGLNWSIARCIYKDWWAAFNNILDCLFKEGNEDEDLAKIVFDLKKDIIEDLMNYDGGRSFWKFEHYVLVLINWGRNNEIIRKDIWNTNKYFIALFKNFIGAKMIPNLVLGKNRKFFPSIFEDHKDESDFGKTLWDLKEYLLKKIVNDKNCTLLCQLFEKFEELNKFLNWNGFSETGMRNLKKLIFDEKGVQCCHHWISNDKFSEMKYFLDWYGNDLNFKRSVISKLAENLLLRYSWTTLKYFLNLKFNLNLEEDKINYSMLKNYVSESCGVDICYNWILQNKWDEIPSFLQWSFEPLENEKLIPFKTRLIEKHGPDYCNARIFDNDWEKLEKFLNWCFESYEEDNEREGRITNLKIKTLQYTIQEDVCYKNNLEMVLNYLEWGFKSKARLKNFKKSILEKNHPLNYFVTLRKYKSRKNFQRWFFSK